MKHAWSDEKRENSFNWKSEDAKILGLSRNTTEDSNKPYFNPLQTKRRPLYLNPQSVPRSKHFSYRL